MFCETCIDRLLQDPTPRDPWTRDPITRASFIRFRGDLTIRPGNQSDTIIIVLDTSLSMGDPITRTSTMSRLKFMRSVIRATIQHLIGYNIELYTFDTTVSHIYSGLVSHETVPAIKAALLRPMPNGRTYIGGAIQTIVESAGTRTSTTNAIIFTDGECTERTVTIQAILRRIPEVPPNLACIHIVAGFYIPVEADILYNIANKFNSCLFYIFDHRTCPIIMSSLIATIMYTKIFDRTQPESTATKLLATLIATPTIDRARVLESEIPTLQRQAQAGNRCVQALLLDCLPSSNESHGQIHLATHEYAHTWGDIYLHCQHLFHKHRVCPDDIAPPLQFYGIDMHENGTFDAQGFQEKRTQLLASMADADITTASWERRGTEPQDHQTMAAVASANAQDRGGCFGPHIPVVMCIVWEHGHVLMSHATTPRDLMQQVDAPFSEPDPWIKHATVHTNDDHFVLYGPPGSEHGIVTMWHPVRDTTTSEWLPAHQVPGWVAHPRTEQTVYNFQMMPAHDAYLGIFTPDTKYQLATLCMTQSGVPPHPYFASQRLVDQLDAHPSRVHHVTQVVRDSDNLVAKWCFA